MSLIQRYAVYRLASNTVFYLPVLILVFRLRLDSIELALALVSVYTVAVAIAELPSGLIADTLGYRATLALGLVSALLGTLLLAVGQSFLMLALAQVFSAVAFSLRSGTESVYLYDLLANQALYQRYEGRTSAANYIALSISSAAGSVLYSLNSLAPFALTLIAASVALAFLLSLPHRRENASARRPSPLQVVRQASLSLIGRRGVLPLLSVFALLLTATALVYWTYQLFLDHLGLPTSLFGLLYAVGFIASASGSWVAEELNKWLGFRSTLLLAILTTSGTMVVMGSATGWWAAGLPLVTQFLTGYLLPSLRYLLQERANSESRATLLSLESMMQRGLLTMATVAFGVASSSVGLDRALQAAGVVVLVLTLPLLPFAFRAQSDVSTI